MFIGNFQGTYKRPSTTETLKTIVEVVYDTLPPELLQEQPTEVN
jgi:hypothetical protein